MIDPDSEGELLPYKVMCDMTDKSGVNKTCTKARYQCNCDANDLQWREDSGFLSDKTDLPVKQLRFGDTRQNYERGYHT